MKRKSSKTAINRKASEVHVAAEMLIDEVARHSYLGQFVSKYDRIGFARGRKGVIKIITKLDRALARLKTEMYYGSRWE
jgi:hypothetical protein